MNGIAQAGLSILAGVRTICSAARGIVLIERWRYQSGTGLTLINVPMRCGGSTYMAYKLYNTYNMLTLVAN